MTAWTAIVLLLQIEWEGHRVGGMSRPIPHLPKNIETYLMVGGLTSLLTKRILRIPEEDRAEVFDALSCLKPNQNKWVQILDWLYDISRRDGLTVKKVLIDSLLPLEGFNNPHERLDALRDRLEGIRFPEYRKQMEAFEGVVAKLDLPRTIQMTPSPYFEDNSVEIRCHLSNDQQRRELIEALSRDEWKSLFEMLS